MIRDLLTATAQVLVELLGGVGPVVDEVTDPPSGVDGSPFGPRERRFGGAPVPDLYDPVERVPPASRLLLSPELLGKVPP